MKKVAIIFIVSIFSVLTLTSNYVFADEVTKKGKIDADIDGGILDLETSDVKSFKTIKIKHDDQFHYTGFNGDFTITDLRGLHEDWQLSVSATPLTSTKNSKDVFKRALSIVPPNSIERVGDTTLNTKPDIVLNSNNVLDDGNVLLAESNNGSGLGKFSLGFPDNAIRIDLTPEIKRGDYTSTITWNLMSVPTK